MHPSRRTSLLCSSLFIPSRSSSLSWSLPSTLLSPLLLQRSRNSQKMPVSTFQKRSASSSAAMSSSSNQDDHQATSGSIDVNLLARAWTSQLLLEQDNGDKRSTAAMTQAAAARTLPLLQEQQSVPFLCRYRTDLVSPLSTAQVHTLADLTQKHASLANLRQKLLEAIASNNRNKGGEKRIVVAEDDLATRILTSTNKAELEDWYAPYKPPPKGSIAERIRQEHPELCRHIDELWASSASDSNSRNVLPSLSMLQPRDDAVYLLGTKIAAEPSVMDDVLTQLHRHLVVSIQPQSASTAAKKKDDKQKKPEQQSSSSSSSSKEEHQKYETYYEFEKPLHMVRDHQILAIRRGVAAKVLKISYSIDGDRVQENIYRTLTRNNIWSSAVVRCLSSTSQQQQRNDASSQSSSSSSSLADDAIKDAWSRLLRRRCINRLWNDACQKAEARATDVFCQNLQSALLAPPLAKPSYVLALDPGFSAGIKCAVLDPNGEIVRAEATTSGPLSSEKRPLLETVKFLGNGQRQQALQQLGRLAKHVQEFEVSHGNHSSNNNNEPIVQVALGNGHGTRECRLLMEEAASLVKVPIHVQLVSEAGASVWSVTPSAHDEFPNHTPAAVAAVSIGRRLQNPLHELVKIPPRSLGLGMYQHDLTEKDLDAKLHLVSVDAVAVVGVDANTGSMEILRKVPGLDQCSSTSSTSRSTTSNTLVSKIIQARPLTTRADLLKIPKLGPKTFENCAGFLRVSSGKEPLDNTMVHPESYDLARFLLKAFGWKLGQELPEDLPPRQTWATKWSSTVNEACRKFDVPRERVLAVLEHLVDSMNNQDPRLTSQGSHDSAKKALVAGSSEGCSLLSQEDLDDMPSKCPLRKIVGSIRTITDFGAFVDFGGENDGLLHKSKLGPSLRLDSLLVGETIGVDILSVDGKRISLGLAGLDLQPDPPRQKSTPAGRGQSGRRNMSTAARPPLSQATGSSKKKRVGAKSDQQARPTKRRKAG